MRRWTFVILILTSSPIFVPGTKTTKFAIRASPSPSRPISSILASYTFPSSTGTFEGRKPDPEYDIHDSMRRPSATATFRIGCTVYNDIGVGPRSDPWTSRLAQRVQVFLDIRGSGEPQAQDQTDDPDDQHDESDRGHEPVPRTKGIEGGEFADANPELVMEPRSQCNPGAAEEDQEDARVEEELLAETGLPLAPFVIVGFVGCQGHVDLPAQVPPFRGHRCAGFVAAVPVLHLVHLDVAARDRDHQGVAHVRRGLGGDLVLEDGRVRRLGHPPEDQIVCPPARDPGAFRFHRGFLATRDFRRRTNGRGRTIKGFLDGSRF